MMKNSLMTLVFSALTLVTTQVKAQTPASSLQDLVGVRGSGGEMELKRRGYEYIKTEKSATDSYSYWRETSTGKCLTVRTSDGRYQSLVYAPAFDCRVAQSSGRRITINFPSGSHCGTYAGRINTGDTFLLNLAREQQLIIEQSTPHDYTVQAPNGEYLEVIQTFPNDQNQYWTGNQFGNFQIEVASVPQGRPIDIKFCAYSGEGE
ncbi:hypothetical protein [Crocosphaera chwakensis]|nr:hypothetical protein [Crocosphaera chwakensis]